jgi:hypothetical protein
MKVGSIVVVAAFDEVPKHLFLVQEVFEDFVAGVVLTGPLAGSYGEPDRSQLRPLGTDQSL